MSFPFVSLTRVALGVFFFHHRHRTLYFCFFLFFLFRAKEKKKQKTHKDTHQQLQHIENAKLHAVNCKRK